MVLPKVSHVSTALRAGLAAILLSGCVTITSIKKVGYEPRFLVLRTYNLFNQRIPPNDPSYRWLGDWVFRRERLSTVDAALRESKPDVLVFQQLMAKKDSDFESDTKILSSGALDQFEWHVSPVRYFSDTAEQEYHGIAYSLPLRLVPSEQPEMVRIFADEMMLTVSVLALENEPLAIFNIEALETVDETVLAAVIEAIEEKRRELGICKERVVIAGFLGTVSARKFSELAEAKLAMKNSSAGFCEIETQCFTTTPLNGIYLISGNNSSYQSDYIFTHADAIVASSHRTFTEEGELSEAGRMFGMQGMWGSRTYGLESNIRFKRCSP